MICWASGLLTQAAIRGLGTLRSRITVQVREGTIAYHHAVHANNDPGRQGPVDSREVGRHKLVLDAARQVRGLCVQLQEVDRPIVEGVVCPVCTGSPSFQNSFNCSPLERFAHTTGIIILICGAKMSLFSGQVVIITRGR